MNSIKMHDKMAAKRASEQCHACRGTGSRIHKWVSYANKPKFLGLIRKFVLTLTSVLGGLNELLLERTVCTDFII
jgi:hypothetical protein